MGQGRRQTGERLWPLFVFLFVLQLLVLDGMSHQMGWLFALKWMGIGWLGGAALALLLLRGQRRRYLARRAEDRSDQRRAIHFAAIAGIVLGWAMLSWLAGLGLATQAVLYAALGSFIPIAVAVGTYRRRHWDEDHSGGLGNG